MKVHNAVIGMEVQVKRDCCGYVGEFIKEGLVCSIRWIDEEDGEGYELSLVHPDIDDGFAWVNASDVRKYIKPTESPEPVDKLSKGTRVQVKRTLVGKWGEKLQEGDIYILQGDEDVSFDGAHRRIDVKAVAGSSSWSTQPKYFDVLPDEVVVEPQDDPKPTEPTFEPDDIVELREDCVAKHGELIPQGLYIVGFVDSYDDTCTVLTVHGGMGQASLPMAKVHKVGVCNATNG